MAKAIPLTRSQYAIVDDEDYGMLSSYRWYAAWNKYTKSYYAVRGVWNSSLGRNHILGMHRTLLGLGRGSPDVVDHVNHDTLDNRRENLRLVSHSQNIQNTRPYTTHKGVYFCPKRGRKVWLARLSCNHQIVLDKYFYTKEEAILARKEAEDSYFGEFAYGAKCPEHVIQ